MRKKSYFKKNSIFPNIMNGVISNLGVNGKEKDIALYISLIYDLGLMSTDSGF